MSITYDWNTDFDAEKWEDLINSDEIFTEQFSKSINTIENSNVICDKKDIVKLSINDFKRSTFLHTDKFLHLSRVMIMFIPPSSNQRVRYENECKNIFRYISVPNNKPMTIKIPDLRDILIINDVLWMRITRTTINHRRDSLIFYHPYPIWIKNKNAKIHQGSIFIQITDKDMENGFIEISTLAMIRLKQDALAKIKTLAIFSSTQLDFFGRHSIEIETPKRIRDEYKLRQSILNFQLVRVDQHNTAYPTDCLCQTEAIHELEASGQRKTVEFHQVKKIKSKKGDRRKKL